MEVRDPVHGSIHILDEIVPILRADFFQRLRNIKQLGFSEYIFPGATHTRFLHSIGVMNVGERIFNKLFPESNHLSDFKRLRETFKLACLLHDIGHAPLSHTTEIVMPNLFKLNIPNQFLSAQDQVQDRRATHEDYTIKAIGDSSLANSFKEVEQKYGVERKYIADLIRGSTDDAQYFTIEGINYFPLLSQLVSSELDCDRMDYLLRDSYFCGVSYGNFDLDWMIDNLEVCIDDKTASLGITERAVVTFDDFLLSRYHMFVMVYFHYQAVCLEQLLHRYFAHSPGEYEIPANIEEYIKHDDHHLMKVLRNSQSPYAQSIVKNDIPTKIYESFNEHQLGQLNIIQAWLDKEGLEYIRCSSTGRLSKYYQRPTPDRPLMKVVRKIYGKKSHSATIEEATDLFQKFSKSHEVHRLHCRIDQLPKNARKELSHLLI
jgi:uncharacterized protein